MIIGYLTGRLKILPGGSSDVLSRFVFMVAMPSLIFIAVSRVTIAAFFDWPFLATLGGGMMIMFILGMIVSKQIFKAQMTIVGFHGLASMFSSTAYIGLPLILTLFGDEGLVYGIIGAVITGVIFAPITIVIAEFDRDSDRRQQLWKPFFAALTKPPIIATGAGLVVSASGLVLPGALVSLFETIGDAFVPCALFAAGLFIAECTVRSSSKEVGWLVFAKLILHPLITWWLAFHVFSLSGIAPTIAVIQAALPLGVPVFVMAQHYGTFVAQSSAVIAWSTAISIFTLSILLGFLHY